MKTATAKLLGASVSPKNSRMLLGKIKNKNMIYAKSFLNNIIDEKVSVNRKYYTHTAEVLLTFIESAEANAKQKNLNTEKLFIKMIVANKGEKKMRGRSRWNLRGRVGKSTNLEVILEER